MIPSAKHLQDKVNALGFDFEQNKDELFQNFYEFSIGTAIHYAFYQNTASEVLSRRNAMDGANKNCKELKVKLGIVFNKLRQSLITTDLIEVTSGAAVVEEMGR